MAKIITFPLLMITQSNQYYFFISNMFVKKKETCDYISDINLKLSEITMVLKCIFVL